MGTRKYFYMRLKDDFFRSQNMIYLQTMKNGYELTVLLLKLYLLSVSDNGRIAFTDVPGANRFSLLSRMTGHTVKFIKEAIPIFEEFGLVETLSNGAIYVPAIPALVGKASEEADRQREYQRKKKAESEACEKTG